MRRDAAKVNAAYRGDQTGRCVPVQKGSGAAGVLAVGLIEIAHLHQHNAVREGVFEIVVFSPKRGQLLFFMGVCANQGKLLLRKITALCNQILDTFGNFAPGESDVSAIFLLVADTFAVVILAAATGTGQGMTGTSDAIFVLEKVHLFLRRMLLLEKREDTGFPSCKAAAAVNDTGVNLVLCDKRLVWRKLGHRLGD